MDEKKHITEEEVGWVLQNLERDQRPVAQPRVVMPCRVPEMDMRVDHGEIGRHPALSVPPAGFRAAACPVRSAAVFCVSLRMHEGRSCGLRL